MRRPRARGARAAGRARTPPVDGLERRPRRPAVRPPSSSRTRACRRRATLGRSIDCEPREVARACARARAARASRRSASTSAAAEQAAQPLGSLGMAAGRDAARRARRLRQELDERLQSRSRSASRPRPHSRASSAPRPSRLLVGERRQRSVARPSSRCGGRGAAPPPRAAKRPAASVASRRAVLAEQIGGRLRADAARARESGRTGRRAAR